VSSTATPLSASAPGLPPGAALAHGSHHARITGPVSYAAGSGRRQLIPIGPCLVERWGGQLVDIIWGVRGQSSVALPEAEVQAAQDQGHLVLLD
jgi:hypothetical protein